MIANIDDLIAYTKQKGARAPSIAKDVVLDRPGSSPDEIAAMANSLPGIPGSYLSAVAAVNVRCISIDGFGLSPTTSPRGSLLDQLLEYNAPENYFMAEYVLKWGAYRVAAAEADPIAVAGDDSPFEPGQILWFDIYNPEEPPRLLADNFEQFLIVAGNLDEIRDKYNDAADQIPARGEFDKYLRTVPNGARFVPAWTAIAEVVLS